MSKWMALSIVSGMIWGLLSFPAIIGAQESAWAPAVAPKPLCEQTKKGLAWLIQHQLPSGGWGQGEESAAMRHSGQAQIKDTANVADTCMATLALLRSGSTPAKGEYASNICAALNFLCSEVEGSDEKSLFITKIQGTRVQSKLGTYIDTFLTAMILSEVKGQMSEAASEKRILAALDKTMDKIERNQRADGTWDNRGWAPVLSQAMGTKAINRARQAGVSVEEGVREKAEKYAGGQVDPKGDFRSEGSAGVDLYSTAGNLGAMQDSANTNAEMARLAKEKLATATTEAERNEAQKVLERVAENDRNLERAQSATVAKLQDKRFIQGFGSNGGEEFLSYMNIGESLVVKGGEAWEKWDRSITENLNRIQNADGSWTGHHCITGRTFCTASALLVLMVDRTPVPTAAKIRKQ